MSEMEEKEVLLDIPNLNWPSWETLVAAALDGIAGVVSYEVKAMRREAKVKYNAKQMSENELMEALKKKTRYRSMSIKKWPSRATRLVSVCVAGGLKTEGKMANFVYTLSKNDLNLAARCFQFAKVTHEKGHSVHIFFIEDGTLWADNTRDFTEKTITGDCPGDYFPYLVENEIPIGVWPPCANARQVDEARFFSNMMLDGAPHLIDLMADGKVFNF